MKVIGLTGSIAMGKSAVAKIFQERGIPVFDADAAVHELYDSERGALLIADFAPEAVVGGKVDRAILTRLVLADPALLTKLEPRIHAEIRKIRNDVLERARRDGIALAVVDMPLLFETGQETGIDKIIVVSSDPEIQLRRALARPGMTREKFDMIKSRQMPDSEKRKRADIIIENSGNLEDLRVKVMDLIDQLKDEASHA
jgi:dephospho-CoA kinase